MGHDAAAMPRRVITICLSTPVRQMLTARFFFLVTIISLSICLIWLQLLPVTEQPLSDNSLILEVIDNVERDTRYSAVYRKTSRLPKELKYILLWTDRDYAPFYYFGEGQRAFIKNNCSVINCYVTSDRNFLEGDVTKFDAVAFNGRNMKTGDLPKLRSLHQKYVFFNMESADNYPVCSETFDGFFNWTSTYKLSSDIPFPYILVRNSKGEVIGPKKDMIWPEDLPAISEDYAERLENKSKAAAWFVSHCTSRSERKELVDRLKTALALYKQTVDVYGACGPLDCPRDKKIMCDRMLGKHYYFYMSLENSFAEDYVTEKLLTALQHDVVPVIFGGADYDRFLPPGSYLDARKFNAYDLATIMDRLMYSPKLYQEFFRWKGHVTFSDPSAAENVCNFCAALNDEDMVRRTTVYHEFRKWWNPEFHERCREIFLKRFLPLELVANFFG